MSYFDSHAHFTERDGPDGFARQLEDARRAGVSRVIAIGGSPALNAAALDAAGAFAGMVRAAVGFDRDYAEPPLSDAQTPAQLADALRLLIDGNPAGVAAVGETGLDYHYAPQTAGRQMALCEAQFEVAIERRLPVVVHSRDAETDTLALLRRHVERAGGDRPGVLHCFTGDAKFARELLDLGFFIGFSGIVTFRNADPLRAVARLVPEDRLLIETDCPYLAPVPLRGRRNEPAFVMHVARVLAEVRGVSESHIADVTMHNGCRLFGDQ